MFSMQQIRRRKWWLGITLALSRASLMPRNPSSSTRPKRASRRPMSPATTPAARAGRRKSPSKCDKPWPQVFEWLRLTRLPFITTYKPAGSFTHIARNRPPLHDPKSWTPSTTPCRTSIICSTAARARSALSPWMRKHDQLHRSARIKGRGTSERGKTELVPSTVPLNVLVAEDFAPEIRKMLSNFGQATPLVHLEPVGPARQGRQPDADHGHH